MRNLSAKEKVTLITSLGGTIGFTIGLFVATNKNLNFPKQIALRTAYAIPVALLTYLVASQVVYKKQLTA